MPSFTSAGFHVNEKTKPGKRKPAPAPRKTPKKKKRRGPSRPVVISVCILLIAILLSALVLYLYFETRSYAGTFLPGIYLSGESLDGLTYEQAVAKLKTLETKELGEFVCTVECEQDAYSLTAEDLGMVYDTEATLDELYALGRADDLVKRFLAIRELRAKHIFADPVMRFDLTAASTLLDKIREDYESDPVDATVTFDSTSSSPFVFTDEMQGMRVDTAGALRKIETTVRAGSSDIVEVQTELIPPEVTQQELEENLQILSRISVSLGTDMQAAENAELALLQFSGRRIEPGATVSFNESVGARTEENGYVRAPEPAYGIDVSGTGGGVCMASSLLYRGALLAGLEITERSPAAVLVSFCTPGEEATVSDTGLDLKFRNPTSYPVFIRCRIYAEDGGKTACLEFFGKRQADNLTLVHETEILPAPEEPVYLLDKTGTHAVYNDERVLRNEAMDGAAVTTYRVQQDKNHKETGREQLSEERYEPLPACYYIGSQVR